MKGLTRCLLTVGVFYLLEGAGGLLLSLVHPESAAALWAPTAPVGSLDAVAVQAIVLAGLFTSLSWLVLGVLMLYFAGQPARARVLVIVIVALELLAWAPIDVVSLGAGWPVARSGTVLAIHIAIGVAGILVLRSSSAPELAIGDRNLT